MTKTELITELLGLYDQIDDLKRKLDSSVTSLGEQQDTSQFKILYPIDEKFAAIGRQLVVEKVMSHGWNTMDYSIDEDGIEHYTSYNKWFCSKIDKSDIPRNLSYDEFISCCDDEIHALYEKEKAKEKERYIREHEENEED